MKYSIVIFFSLIFCSCSKKNCEIEDPSLVGEWKRIEQNVSDGSESKWEEVQNGDEFSLKADGTYEGINIFNDCGIGTYEFAESELRLSPSCTTNSEDFIYSLTRECDDLILSPLTVICIEGCAYRYERIN